MFDQERIKAIKRLINSIATDLQDFSDRTQGFYFDYDKVQEQLEQTEKTISDTLQCQWPDVFSTDMHLSEKTILSGEEEFPHLLDGSMSAVNFEISQNIQLIK